jgi:hypothetical protein
LKIIQFNPKLYFIHILVLEFERKDIKSSKKLWMRGKNIGYSIFINENKQI